MAEKLAPEVAQKEVEAWLDYKKIPAHKRESHKDAIESLVNGLVSGSICIGENKVITYTLEFPLGADSETPVESLDFKPRLSHDQIALRTKNVKASDADGRIMAYIGALTNKSTGTLGKLDTVDLDICQSIAVFFM